MILLDRGLQVVNLQMNGTRKAETCHLEKLMIMPAYLWATDRKRGKGKGEFYLILNLILVFLT